MRLLYLLPMVFLISALWAQQPADSSDLGVQDEQTPEKPSLSAPFPLALVMEQAEWAQKGMVRWQPDWPVQLPPDAFSLKNTNWQSITLDFGEEQCSLVQDNGQFFDFPLVLQGLLLQARFEYDFDDDQRSLLKNIALGEDIGLEAMEYIDSRPSLLRVLQDDVYSFVLLRYGTGFINESWFDPDGVFLEAYEYRYSHEYERITAYTGLASLEQNSRDFDSRFLVTRISGNDGDFSINYYGESLPRYWNRRPVGTGSEAFSFQWDMNNMLVSLRGETDGDDGSMRTDSRFEYVLDDRGNWIERREVLMIASNGLFVPVAGKTIRRVIDYGDNDE